MGVVRLALQPAGSRGRAALRLRAHLAARPPDRKPAALAAQEGGIVRQDEEAERYHPEAQHRQEAEAAEEDQQDADRRAPCPRLRKFQAEGTDDDLMGGVIDAETGSFGLFRFHQLSSQSPGLAQGTSRSVRFAAVPSVLDPAHVVVESRCTVLHDTLSGWKSNARACHLVPLPQSIKEEPSFCKKALGKSVQRLYDALIPQRADDPW